MKGRETLLKAKLKRHPAHRRSLPLLLEALALWQGEKVHAALCVDDAGGSFDMWRYQPEFDDTPLYQLEWVPIHRPRHGRDEAHEPSLGGLSGLGDFGDLQELLAWEVAR